MKVATAADTTALQTWFDNNKNVAVLNVLWNGTAFVIIYSAFDGPTSTMRDRVNSDQ